MSALPAESRAVVAAILLAVTLGFAGASRAAEEDLLEQARAAANAGDLDRSLELYDRHLDANPQDVRALNQSAQQLSWSRRFDEALQRYGRVLAIEPDNYFARLERAKVLSWARRYPESVEAFRQLLASDPADMDARLGLARVLSWSGELTESRAHYQQILDDRPGEGTALLGVAQTYAWSGDLRQARRYYEQAALAMDEPKDAEVGLAYIDLWEGASGRALESAEDLDARHAADGDVGDLLRAAQAATAPWVATGWDRMTDSDDHRISTWRAEAGFWIPLGVASRLSYVDYDIESQQQRGKIRSLQVRFDWVPLPEHRVSVMGGVDRWERPSQDADHTVDWGFNYAFPVRGTWSGWVGASREPYRYSVQLIDNRIVIDSFGAGASGTIPGDWRASSQLGLWNTSDGNRRLSADLSARHQWRLGAHGVETGVNLRWLDWREELGNGYFDPSGFSAVGVPLRASGPLSEAYSISYDVSVELGLQSFSFAGSRTSPDPYYIAVGRLTQEVTEALRIEAFAEAGSYASEGSNDWRYSRAGARLVWRFGQAGN